MAGLRDIQRTIISDCYLLFPNRDSIRMPVARFDAVFELNTLPQATVVPALGKEIIQKTRVSLSDIAEGDEVSLILNVDGEERLIMEGFISTISGSDNSTPFSRRLSASILIVHRAVILAGAPTASFAYTASAHLPYTPLSDLKVYHPLFGRNNAVTTQYSLSSFKTEVEERFGTIDTASFPGTVIRYIAELLMQDYAEHMAEGGTSDLVQARAAAVEAAMEDLIQTYDPANLTLLNVPPAALLQSYANTYIASWKTSNNWEALVRTAREFFLHIVPYNKGVYLSNALSLNREALVEIPSSAYTSISQKVTDTLSEPVDGVVLFPPEGSIDPAFKVVFPDYTEGEEAEKHRYYHYRKYPSWIQNFSTLYYNDSTGKVSEVNRGAIKSSRMDIGDE